MAKVIPLLQAMDKQDRDDYILGFESYRSSKNPYDENVNLRRHQAWSAGHYDKHEAKR